MAFCKVCDCGNKIVFARRLAFPMQCPACGRDTTPFETYPEGAPEIEKRIREIKGSGSGPAADAEPSVRPDAESHAPQQVQTTAPEAAGSQMSYSLSLPGGVEIPIPDGGCIIGRTETGGEELAEYGSVSRQHVRIKPMRQSGVLIEDLSTYGTWVDGRKLEKNIPQRVFAGVRITLCNLETTLISRS